MLSDNQKAKLKKAVKEGKVSDKTTLQIFNMVSELEEKVESLTNELKLEVEKSVAEVKASEVSLDKVLESIKGKDGKDSEIPGPQGEQGIQGEKGEKGDKGDQGVAGKNGKDGRDGLDGKDGLDGQDGLPGEDGSPDTRLQIIEKINSGKKKDLKIALSQLEDFTKLTKDIEARALSILDQRTKFLINKGVKHDSSLSGEGTDASPLSVVGGGPGGADWGDIGGILSDQTDLQTALDAKLPLAGGTMAGNITLGENTSIALDPAGSADGKYTGITIAGTAGATLAFGDLVYLAAADSRWELADADGVTTADRMLGMCVLAAAADGDPTVLLLVGQIRADAAFPALTIGSAVYVGETAGDIQVAIPTGADNVIRRVGYALTADEIYFNPSMDSQTTVA